MASLSVPPIVVSLPIADRPTSYRFYRDGLGLAAIGDRELAPRGHSECLLGLTAESPEQVSQLVERARQAGAELVTAAGPQPWGYTGTFADPDGHLWMVTAAVPTS